MVKLIYSQLQCNNNDTLGVNECPSVQHAFAQNLKFIVNFNKKFFLCKCLQALFNVLPVVLNFDCVVLIEFKFICGTTQG